AALLFVGASRHLKITEAGRLYLGSKLSALPSCTGKYSVKVYVLPGVGNDVVSIKSKLASGGQIWVSGQFGGRKTGISQNASDTSVGSSATASSGMTTSATTKTLAVSRASLDEALGKDLQSLPRRVNDEFKNLGDMVNFVLIGSEKKVQAALA